MSVEGPGGQDNDLSLGRRRRRKVPGAIGILQPLEGFHFSVFTSVGLAVLCCSLATTTCGVRATMMMQGG